MRRMTQKRLLRVCESFSRDCASCPGIRAFVGTPCGVANDWRETFGEARWRGASSPTRDAKDAPQDKAKGFTSD